MTAWAEEELQYAQLGDVRRNKRLIRLVSDLAAQPNVSVAQLHQLMCQTPAWGQLSLELRRHPDREPRTATLTLRTATLELQPPQTHPERNRLKPMSVQVILAQEDNPPSGVEPVSWLLLTTLLVTCFEDVVQVLRWYSYRWLIERYHYVLKSGCRIEQLQLETDDCMTSPRLGC